MGKRYSEHQCVHVRDFVRGCVFVARDDQLLDREAALGNETGREWGGTGMLECNWLRHGATGVRDHRPHRQKL